MEYSKPISSETHNAPQHLDLRIHTSRVGLYPQPLDNITSDTLAQSAMTAAPPDAFTCLLRGLLDDFLLYSRQEHSQWLVDIAHDICDPALKRGSLHVWDAAEETWKNVNAADPLIASTYLYQVQDVVALSKISERAGKSKTSVSGNASTMGTHVKQRDGKCWVSGSRDPLINSHVCPKRMGDHLLRIVCNNFVSTHAPSDLSIYDEICGISLSPTLDKWFDSYELGLRFVSTNEYECHSFLPSGWPLELERTIYGSWDTPTHIPLLHGYKTSPPQPQKANNPPPGLIRWHYLQCVIRKFAHSDYRNLQNIHYYELPLRMEGDSDDEGTDSEFEWPSAVLDRGRAMRAEIERLEEHQKFVENWVTAAS
ncbi:hypothetical protein APHAL10511_007813 [Amanita phalloides]|nr:hypothetical protein APHAL10511_007813 [Amanita phalloides]